MGHRLLIFILGWYLTSITLSLYNKWMFDPHKGLQVVCPITVTSFHQFILWFLSFVYMKYHDWREGRDHALEPADLLNRRAHQKTDWKFYFSYVVPTAIASAGDIGFGNVSFKFVTLAVYTIIKSSSIAFVLLFGCIFKLEKFHWKLVAIVGIMFFGVLMMVYKPSDQKIEEDSILLLFGSLLVLASSCLSGLRWVFTQLILRKSPQVQQEATTTTQEEATKLKKPHPVHRISQLAPIMGVTLFLTGLIIERPFPNFLNSNLFTQGADNQRTFRSIAKGCLLLIFPGFEVFIMTICEFGILQTAHVLTLSVAGIIKELLTILSGVIFLNERLSGFHNWAGMSIVLLDVAYYNYFRYTQDEQPTESQEGERTDSAAEITDNDTVLISRLKQEPSMDSVSYELSHVNNAD